MIFWWLVRERKYVFSLWLVLFSDPRLAVSCVRSASVYSVCAPIMIGGWSARPYYATQRCHQHSPGTPAQPSLGPGQARSTQIHSDPLGDCGNISDLVENQ